MMFKAEHIPLIINGTKIMTRRRHKYKLKKDKTYRVRKNYFKSIDVWIKILNVHQEKLEEITKEDAYKEGGYTLEEFKAVWKRISGEWDPEETVTVYEFKVVSEPPKPSNLTNYLNIFLFSY